MSRGFRRGLNRKGLMKKHKIKIKSVNYWEGDLIDRIFNKIHELTGIKTKTSILQSAIICYLNILQRTEKNTKLKSELEKMK